MPVEKPRWAFYIFFLVLVEAIALIVTSEITTNMYLIVGGAAILLFILIVLMVIIYLLVHYYARSSSHDSENFPKEDSPMVTSVSSTSSEDQSLDADSEIDEFHNMVQVITDEFHPQNIKNEEESKNQLVRFLDMRFPHHDIVRKGHDSLGEYVDIVIDGTYVFDVCIVSNEGKLIYVLDQLLSAKKDFCDIAVLFIDTGDVPTYTLKKYMDEFETAGIKTVVKKIKM